MLFGRSILPSHSVRAALYCAAAAAAPKIRLHTVAPLYEAAQLVLPDKQRHYLSSVMRVKPGDTVALFNAKLLGRTEAQRQAHPDLTCGCSL